MQKFGKILDQKKEALKATAATAASRVPTAIIKAVDSPERRRRRREGRREEDDDGGGGGYDYPEVQGYDYPDVPAAPSSPAPPPAPPGRSGPRTRPRTSTADLNPDADADADADDDDGVDILAEFRRSGGGRSPRARATERAAPREGRAVVTPTAAEQRREQRRRERRRRGRQQQGRRPPKGGGAGQRRSGRPSAAARRPPPISELTIPARSGGGRARAAAGEVGAPPEPRRSALDEAFGDAFGEDALRPSGEDGPRQRSELDDAFGDAFGEGWEAGRSTRDGDDRDGDGGGSQASGSSGGLSALTLRSARSIAEQAAKDAAEARASDGRWEEGSDGEWRQVKDQELWEEGSDGEWRKVTRAVAVAGAGGTKENAAHVSVTPEPQNEAKKEAGAGPVCGSDGEESLWEETSEGDWIRKGGGNGKGEGKEKGDSKSDSPINHDAEDNEGSERWEEDSEGEWRVVEGNSESNEDKKKMVTPPRRKTDPTSSSVNNSPTSPPPPPPPRRKPETNGSGTDKEPSEADAPEPKDSSHPLLADTKIRYRDALDASPALASATAKASGPSLLARSKARKEAEERLKAERAERKARELSDALNVLSHSHSPYTDASHKSHNEVSTMTGLSTNPSLHSLGSESITSSAAVAILPSMVNVSASGKYGRISGDDTISQGSSVSSTPTDSPARNMNAQTARDAIVAAASRHRSRYSTRGSLRPPLDPDVQSEGSGRMPSLVEEPSLGVSVPGATSLAGRPTLPNSSARASSINKKLMTPLERQREMRRNKLNSSADAARDTQQVRHGSAANGEAGVKKDLPNIDEFGSNGQISVTVSDDAISTTSSSEKELQAEPKQEIMAPRKETEAGVVLRDFTTSEDKSGESRAADKKSVEDKPIEAKPEEDESSAEGRSADEKSVEDKPIEAKPEEGSSAEGTSIQATSGGNASPEKNDKKGRIGGFLRGIGGLLRGGGTSPTEPESKSESFVSITKKEGDESSDIDSHVGLYFLPSAPAAALPLRSHPEYSKYFAMLNANVPESFVKRVCEIDGKNCLVLDMDPDKPFEPPVRSRDDELDDRTDESVATSGDDNSAQSTPPMQRATSSSAPGKLSEERANLAFAKRSATLESKASPGKLADTGRNDVATLFAKRAKDSNIHAVAKPAPGKLADTGRNDVANLFAKRNAGAVAEEMEKPGRLSDTGKGDVAGLFASKAQQATKGTETVAALFAARAQESSVAAAADKLEKKRDDGTEKPALKDDAEYSKYMKMLKMGISIGAVQQALIKDGKDPAIAEMDPSKPVVAKLLISKPCLKDDPEYATYFKMLKMGLPAGAVKQALVRDGKDPSAIDADPNKPFVTDDPSAKDGSRSVKKAPKISRKRLFWTSIDESKLDKDSLWAGSSSDALNLEGLDYDAEEFANLFTEKSGVKKVQESSENKQRKRAVATLIDSRREMNGSILLKRFKRDYKELAKELNSLEVGNMDDIEIKAYLKLLPTEDEVKTINAHLAKFKSEVEREEAISKLCDCEKYMCEMMKVKNASKKLKTLMYFALFNDRFLELEGEIKSLKEACECVRSSDKLRRLMVFALRLGNTLNTDGSNAAVSAITMDSLLKMHEAKAFDKRTSVLHYLVSIIEKNDSAVLSVKDQLEPAKKAERINVDTLKKTLADMSKGLESAKDIALEEARLQGKTFAELKESVDQSKIGQSYRLAESRLNGVAGQLEEAANACSSLLKYFGEETKMPSDVFFCTLNGFISMFEKAREDIDRKARAKARKEMLALKQKERAMLGGAYSPIPTKSDISRLSGISGMSGLSDSRSELSESRSKVLHEIAAGSIKLKRAGGPGNSPSTEQSAEKSINLKPLEHSGGSPSTEQSAMDSDICETNKIEDRIIKEEERFAESEKITDLSADNDDESVDSMDSQCVVS